MMWGAPATPTAFSGLTSGKGAAAAAVAAAKPPQTAAAGANATPSVTAASASASAIGAAPVAAEQTVLFRQQKTPVGFLLSKAVDTLKQHQSRQIHIKELEKMLIQQGFGDLHSFFQPNSGFMRVLLSSERVAFNAIHKTLAFVNPFAHIRDAQALKTKVIFDGGRTGLRIDAELLAACSGADDFVNELLRQREVRAIRTTMNHLRGKLKCLRLSSAPPGRPCEPCDIYAQRKCSNCLKNLQGLILYPLVETEIEETRLRLDKDVKQLWDLIDLPPLDDILKETDAALELPKPGQQASGGRASLKKRNDEKKQSRHRNKFRRIQNTHLFTADELRAFANGGNLQAS